MRIERVQTYVIGNPPPHRGGRNWVFLQLFTDDGLVGVGEAYAVPFSPRTVAHLIEDVAERHVIGADPFRTELLWRTLYSSGYAQIAPHLYTGPIEGAANVQIDTCSPNFLIQESIEQWAGFHTEILKEPIRWEKGYIIPPTKPGLGVELNEEVAARNPIVA